MRLPATPYRSLLEAYLEMQLCKLARPAHQQSEPVVACRGGVALAASVGGKDDEDLLSTVELSRIRDVLRNQAAAVSREFGAKTRINARSSFM